MKPHDVSVSVIKVGDSIKVLSTFTLSVDLPNNKSKEFMVDEGSRRMLQNRIKKMIEGIDFSND